MSERQRPVHNFIGTTISEADLAIITQRQQDIIRIVRGRLHDPSYLSLKDNSIATQGGIMHHRQVAFARIALINRGRALLSHWDDIRFELEIPYQVHYWEASEAAWRVVGMRLERELFRTRMDGGDATSRQLYGGRWVPEVIDAIPGFGVIPQEDAYHFLGMIGGQLPHIDHPLGTLSARSGEATVARLSALTTTLEVIGGSPPYTYAIESGRGFVTVDASTGIIRIGPSDLFASGTYRVTLVVTDSISQVVRAVLLVTLT